MGSRTDRQTARAEMEKRDRSVDGKDRAGEKGTWQRRMSGKVGENWK